MAKLNVVIPAVDVMVNGQAYRKVDRKAQAGDIVKALSRSIDVDAGAYYTVEKDESRGPFYRDNVGSRRFRLERTDLHEVYTLLSVDPPAAPSDAFTYDGAEYREVKRWAEKGERIRIVNRHPNEHRYEQGAEFVVNSVDGDGDVRVTLGDSDRKLVVLSEYAVLEPTVQPDVDPAPEYVEVKRKANVGERIKIIDAWLAGDNYANGSVLTVVGYSGSCVEVSETDRVVADREYVVLEPVTAQAPAQPKRYTAGDFVKVVREGGAHNYEVGSVVKVTRLDIADLFYAEKADGSTGNMLARKQTEPATETEFLAQRKPAEPARLEVGDIVRIHRARYAGDRLKIGEVRKVAEVDSSFVPYRADKLDGSDHDWFREGDLGKLTAEETAAIEKEAQETAKWAEIGRKVGEFKRGDVAKVVSTLGAEGLSEGSIVEVVGPDGTDAPSVKLPDGDTGYAVVTLVTPVEQRFDTEQAA
jgi:hypothetical protein